LGKLIASDTAANDYFGHSVACNESKIIVGAPYEDPNGLRDAGSVYVYDLDGTNEIKIVASDAAISDNFGISVACNESKIVVGAFYEDPNGITEAGSVYVYDLDGTNEIKIVASDADGSDFFGISVACNESKIIVGAYYEDPNGIGAAGSVYVYDLDGTNEIKIRASDAAVSDYFGYSVACNESKIIVGAYNEDPDGIAGAGSVYVYDLDGTNEIKIVASDADGSDRFGYSVACNESKIIVGAYNEDPNGIGDAGSVYVYDLDGTNEIKIVASDAAADDYFGVSVACNQSKIIVGAPYEDPNGLANAGSVYVYDLDGTNEIKIVASDAASYDYFGFSVACNESKIIVGAPQEDPNGIGDAGSVYIFE